MVAQNQEMMALLLISLLGFVLLVGGFLVLILLQWRQRRLNAVPATGENPAFTPSTILRHALLKRPGCWLAVKNRNLLAVQRALSLHNPKPCSLAEGFAGDAPQRLFISPPVAGWILVTGSALPDPADDVDACFRFLLELSRKLGQVQFFSSSHMLNQHAWAQLDAGHVLRGYAWAGKTLWNQGNPTPAEQDLNLKCYGYTESPDLTLFRQPEPGSSNADKVHLLAARWSIDPEDLDERFIEQGLGIVGEPSRHF